MKLMMICDYPLAATDITGGVPAAAYNLVTAMLEHTPLEIAVIGFWHDFDDSEPRVHTRERLKIIRIPKPKPRAHLRNFRSERRLFSRFIKEENPDVIHAQGESIYSSIAVSSGIPNVYTIHGVALKELRMQKPEIGLFSYLLRSRLIKNHHRAASNIVAINKYTDEAIKGLHNARVRIIHNAVDERFFDLYSPDEPQPGRLLLVGGVRPRKDIITCMKAMDLLHTKGVNVSIDIVGPNEADELEKVHRFIEEHQLIDRVRIHGLVSSDAVEEFYRKADIFVMSSIEESSPIAIVQAMAAGKPVVSTNVGGIAEMVTDAANGYLVNARDSAALASNIEKLVTDRAMRSEFSIASRQVALDDWSTKAVALKTYEMYKEMTGER